MNAYIDVYGAMHCPNRLKKVVEGIRGGFNAGFKPKLTDEGTSGVYLMRDGSKQSVAVFKPIDEEVNAPNNPRMTTGPFGSETFKPGILSGESCIRECAAYLIDHGHFSDVPPTVFVEVVHGSLKYIPFSGQEVTSNEYLDIMSVLISPSVTKEIKLTNPES
jgi:hypothetical protein